MKSIQIIPMHHQMCTYAINGSIADAMYTCKKMLADGMPNELYLEYDQCRDIYGKMLDYSMQGAADPQRREVLNILIVRLIDLADKIKEYHIIQQNPMLKLAKQKAYENFNNILARLETLKSEQKKSHKTSHSHTGEMEAGLGNIQISDITQDLFDYILYTDKLGEPDFRLIGSVFGNSLIPLHDRCLIVSAVSLSMMRYFDLRKMDMLFDFYLSGIHQVKQRALIGILFVFFIYDSRSRFYKPFREKIQKSYASGDISEKDVLSIIFQLIRAKDTEKISRKMQDEIIPDIQKLTPKIEDKLDLKNLLSDDDTEAGKNPDWQSILGESPDLMGKLEELSKMQLEGNDVFMSAFSMLKHFPFFDRISNWFVPFYKENTALSEYMDDDGRKLMPMFAASLEKAAYICNSDKYSFMFNLKMMPAQQKQMMLDMFNAELESMNELSDSDALLNQSLADNVIFTQYIQDMYRFVKLHPGHSDFEDVFSGPLDFYNKQFVGFMFPDNSFLLKIADFYFMTDHYSEALDVFLILANKGMRSLDLYQKTAFAYQKKGDFKAALDFYHKAELYDSSQVWCLKKIAYCYSVTKNYQKSLEYYQAASALEPDNTKLQLGIANSFLNMKDYKAALNAYYRVEFTSPATVGVYRPIAWCLFVMGRFKESEAYFMKIFDAGEAGKYDTMNYGHLCWVKGERLSAADMYLKSIEMRNGNADEFFRVFDDDREYLIKHGIEEEEILLMIDFMKFKIESKQ